MHHIITTRILLATRGHYLALPPSVTLIINYVFYKIIIIRNDTQLLQGAFAQCFKMRDRQTGQVYAGKVIEKARLDKPHSKQKV